MQDLMLLTSASACSASVGVERAWEVIALRQLSWTLSSRSTLVWLSQGCQAHPA